jgi:nickel-dependent lactate racemase
MTRTFALPYGQSILEIVISEELTIDLYLPADMNKNTDYSLDINSAIRNPIIKFEFPSFIDRNTTVAITINDKTRPVPNNHLFPPLLNRLLELGIKKENVLIIIATGTHIPMPEYEFEMLLSSETIKEFKVISHNCDDDSNLTFKGTTSRGTPVFVNSLYDKADLKIVVGDIEPHHFAGFSGGHKSASIGVTGRKTINHNHALLQDAKSCVGLFEDNPLRQDIEEIGQLIGVDLALNAILNEKKEILNVFFGHPKEVILAGIKVIKETGLTLIDETYDLVIASAGGYPKDINLYQAQKALTHASLFCKDGGTVLLAAACNEGVGSQSYVDFMKGVTSHSEARDKLIASGFRVGPHKAFQFALIATRINFQIITDISDSIMKELLLLKVDNLQASIDKVIGSFSTPPRIAIVPYATATIPQLRGDK